MVALFVDCTSRTDGASAPLWSDGGRGKRGDDSSTREGTRREEDCPRTNELHVVADVYAFFSSHGLITL